LSEKGKIDAMVYADHSFMLIAAFFRVLKKKSFGLIQSRKVPHTGWKIHRVCRLLAFPVKRFQTQTYQSSFHNQIVDTRFGVPICFRPPQKVNFADIDHRRYHSESKAEAFISK